MLVQLPIGFEGTVCWEDSPEIDHYYYISFSEELLNHEGNTAEQDLYGVFDDFIFFYADPDQQKLLQSAVNSNENRLVLEPNSGWYIDLTKPYEFIYELAYS